MKRFYSAVADIAWRVCKWARRKGGLANGGFFVVGDRKPEIFTPLNINVNFSSMHAADFRRNANEISRAVERGNRMRGAR